MLSKPEAIAQARDWLRVFPWSPAERDGVRVAFSAFLDGPFGLWDAVLLATAREAGCSDRC